MKRLKRIIILILIWLVTIAPGRVLEWYVVFYEDTNTIHKCGRDEYLEMKDLLDNPIIDHFEDLYYYYIWEEDHQEQMTEPFIHKIHYGILNELEKKKGTI